METMIIVLLLMAITLLLYLVVTYSKVDTEEGRQPKKSITEFPDIIGIPKSAVKNNKKDDKSVDKGFNFEPIIESTSIEVPQEEPEKRRNVLPDWEEEEEEMREHMASGTEEGFATGVTFDELATVGTLLERQALDLSEKNIAVSMISRIDGTEILSLLESRVGDTAKKISILLDNEITKNTETGFF